MARTLDIEKLAITEAERRQKIGSPGLFFKHSVLFGIGLPDDRKGEIPVAVVRLGDGDVKERELIDWAREHMADYKAPRQV